MAEKRVSISLTRDEMFQLMDGFGQSYFEDEPDTEVCSRVSSKLSAAFQKFSDEKAGPKK